MFLLTLAAVVGWAEAPGLRAGPSEKDAPTTRPIVTAAEALGRPLARAEFRAMPLEDFSEWVARRGEINVIVRWKALEKAGVTRDAAVTLKLRRTTLRGALVAALDTLSPAGERLAFETSENILTISTQRDFDSRLVTRSYDVQYLVARAEDFSGWGPDWSEIGSGRARQGTLRFSRSSSAGDGADAAVPQNMVDALIHAITQTIRPETWRVNGGKGTIRYFRGQLVIRNTVEVHRILRGQVLDGR